MGINVVNGLMSKYVICDDRCMRVYVFCAFRSEMANKSWNFDEYSENFKTHYHLCHVNLKLSNRASPPGSQDASIIASQVSISLVGSTIQSGSDQCNALDIILDARVPTGRTCHYIEI